MQDLGFPRFVAERTLQRGVRHLTVLLHPGHAPLAEGDYNTGSGSGARAPNGKDSPDAGLIDGLHGHVANAIG
jgi:hypothetical protein